jgi:hypothetical protein
MSVFQAHTYVHSRMEIWRAWVIKKQDNGVGYPKKVSFLKLAPTGGGSAWSPDMDASAWEVERAIQALTDIKREALKSYYLSTLTIKQQVKNLGCCEKTFFNRVNAAMADMLGFLNDIAAGIELPGANELKKTA